MRHEIAVGFGLAALIGVPGIGVYLAARALNIGVTVVPTALDAHWWTVPVLILWALRAGIGEEVVVVGYLFDRLKTIGWSPWVIVSAAAVLRGSYHLYQGFGGFAGNIAMGLVFGGLFLWKRRLAPLIIAHVIIDTTAFVGYPLAVLLFPGVFA
jgi:membrane protease YdiL (CAAX protease family)